LHAEAYAIQNIDAQLFGVLTDVRNGTSKNLILPLQKDIFAKIM